jgi:hypothetical protein
MEENRDSKDYFKSLESHEVKTEDGYLLSLYRVPEENQSKSVEDLQKKKLRQPVLLIHGLAADGSFWLINDRDKSLRKAN